MPPQEERRALSRLRTALGAFQTIDSNMPIQIAVSFLTVALNEGKSLREYGELLDAAQSTMSRHLLDLGPRNRKKEPGFGLIEQRSSDDDMRRNVYTLTAKGRALVQTLNQLLGE